MATMRFRLGFLCGLAALALGLSACSAPVRTTANDIKPCVPPVAKPAAQVLVGEPAKPEVAGLAERVGDLAPCALADAQDSLIDPPQFFWDRFDRDIDLVLQDYRNYYSLPNLLLLGLGVGAMEPVANTPADNHIRSWIQNRGHAHAQSLASLFNYGGQLWVAVPVGLEIAALCGKAPENYASDGGLFEWSNRSLRAIAVGFPPVLAGYALLGSARPDLSNDSHWHPFAHFHGVSGHTFIGAVPFLTAASMTDNPWVKYPLVFGSFLTGWARLYEDRHYFSQVALGWWCAVLAVHSVNLTQDQRLSVVPMVTPAGAGMGIEWHF